MVFLKQKMNPMQKRLNPLPLMVLKKFDREKKTATFSPIQCKRRVLSEYSPKMIARELQTPDSEEEDGWMCVRTADLCPTPQPSPRFRLDVHVDDTHFMRKGEGYS